MQTKDLRNEIKASPAQLRYADTLFYGALLGFIIMLITYALYVFGVLTRFPWTNCPGCGPTARPNTARPGTSPRAGGGLPWWPRAIYATS